MCGIVHVAMSSEFGLDILIAEDPHFCREVLSVSAQKPSVRGMGGSRAMGFGRRPFCTAEADASFANVWRIVARRLLFIRRSLIEQ